jgi:D-alanine-D-alanine ligase
MKKLRVLVLVHETLVPPETLAGVGEEEAAEYRTEYDVTSCLRTMGHDVRPIGIGDSLTELRATIQDWKPHVCFNLLEEFGGIVTYDQHVVAYLELLRQPYTGCNPRGMMLSRDKVLSKQILSYHRIPTPQFAVFRRGSSMRIPARLRYPLFVKSATEDASLGISQASVVEDAGRLRERIAFIHEHTMTDALVEEYIEGRELYVGVLGNERLTALPAWEIDFGTLSQVQSGIATRKVKWDPAYQAKHGIATGPARDLSPAQQDGLCKLAKRIYRALHMSGYARMDLRMRADGSLFVLEANANPNLTFGEDFAESAEAVGISYEALLARIVSLGLAYRPEWRLFES